MIALYASKYTTEDLATLSAALETALTHFYDCSWDCSECAYKRPCKDISKLRRYVEELIIKRGGNR